MWSRRSRDCWWCVSRTSPNCSRRTCSCNRWSRSSSENCNSCWRRRKRRSTTSCRKLSTGSMNNSGIGLTSWTKPKVYWLITIVTRRRAFMRMFTFLATLRRSRSRWKRTRLVRRLRSSRMRIYCAFIETRPLKISRAWLTNFSCPRSMAVRVANVPVRLQGATSTRTHLRRTSWGRFRKRR